MPESYLYLTAATADLTPGDIGNRYLRPAPGSAVTVNIALEKNVARLMCGFSYAEEIDLRAGTGTITARINVTTAGSATCRVRAHRINSTGSILASTDWTATQSTGTTGVKTFTTASVNWTGAASTDRLRLDYEFVTGEHSASVGIQIGTETGARVDVPFTNTLTTSIDAGSAGKGTITPEPGSHVYVVAGKEVLLTATPTDISKKFVKWVINSVDVVENPTTVTMSEDITAVAHFDDADQYDLTISIEEGSGTVNPTAGTHQYYETEAVNITAAPTNELHNVIFEKGAEEFRQTSLSFAMPAENVTVKVYFLEPSVIIERKAGAEGEWGQIAEVPDPVVENPADYLDTDTFQDGVTYFYRAKRFESNFESDWSDEKSIIYEEVAIGDTTVRPLCAEINMDGFAPAVSGQKGATVQAAAGSIEFSGLAPVISVEQNVTISGAVGEIHFAGLAPSISTTASATISAVAGTIKVDGFLSNIVVTANISILSPVGNFEAFGVAPNIIAEAFVDVTTFAITGVINIQVPGPVITVQAFATVQSTVGEIEVDAVPPNVVVTHNAHIINLPPPETEFEGMSPIVVTDVLVEIRPDAVQFEVDGLSPVISSTKNATISAAVSEIKSNGLALVISTVKSAFVQAICGEISARGKLPSFQTTKNVQIDSAVGLIGVEGLSPVISSTIGSPVLTASQTIDNYIYVEWEVG